MPESLSFTKYEKELVPQYRNALNHAESGDEVSAAFERVVGELFSKVFGEEAVPGPDVVALASDEEHHYTINENFLEREEISSIWDASDLKRILGRLAECGVNRLSTLAHNAARQETKPRGN